MKAMILLAGILLFAGGQGCDVGWVQIQESCFMFHMNVMLSWQDARAFCQDSESDLAKVVDGDTHRGVYVYIHTYGLSGSFWLGASDTASEGDWVWVTDDTRVEKGTPYWALGYNIFGFNQEPTGGPDENCLALDEERKYFFNDASCNLTYHPICMK
ncbi:hypothetical protein OTU49_005877 [Cherax quadricarinatus]|uniref:C-type lectin domain-containing protein n=1 Tax=Cherax quadricarinatus TaxID=27406 RepID=A0AAW0YI42_CHEQU|nr:perlucin-like [Cherax quadricarinatus]